MSHIKITANDKEIINYLNKLWNDPPRTNNNRFYNIFTYFANIYYNYMNPNKLLDIKKNISELKNIGFTLYNGTKINNEQPIEHENIDQDLITVQEFLNGNNDTRKELLNKIVGRKRKGKKICYCTIIYKYKRGLQVLDNYPTNNLDNFRFYINHHNTIKILDRIWMQNVIINSIDNLPDSNIFKVKLIKNDDPSELINVANNNTLSIDNVILLDLIKAYDSINWDVLRELLYYAMRRKMNIIYATELLEQYMCIITNRVVTYEKTVIKVSKSIPTGLPSSILVFTYIIEEIINRWLFENTNNFQINIDFIINIYVDDIYIKILNLSKTNIIIIILIKILNKYKLNISQDKSRISKNLNNNTFKELKYNDLYLGIPFTRDISVYMEIIINECNKKHNFNYTWRNIYDILTSSSHEHKKLLIGYLNYKLKPILNNMTIVDFIHTFIN